MPIDVSDAPARTWGPKPQRPRDVGSARAREHLARAGAIDSVERAREVYAAWAPTYDRDVFGSLKIVGPAGLARHAVARVPADAEILDVGCGTGVVASHLRASGFETVDGLDVSPEMLEVARAKGVYRRLIEADLLAPLDIADAAYDAVVSAGTFVRGHVDATALEELCRIVRPGGHLVFNVAVSFWDDGGFGAEVGRLSDTGTVSVVDDVTEPITVDETAHARVLVLARS